jgi:hypothetical protein
MADVSIYVAAISAGAALIGTAIPQLSTAIRDSRKAERDRREQNAQTRRQASMELLRAAGQLRARVADYYDHHGEDMAARLAEVRGCAAETQLCAASVALLPPGSLADEANAVAAATGALAAAAAKNTGLRLGAMSGSPDFRSLDECVENFRKRAEAEARG